MSTTVGRTKLVPMTFNDPLLPYIMVSHFGWSPSHLRARQWDRAWANTVGDCSNLPESPMSSDHSSQRRVMFGSLCPFRRSWFGGSEGSLMESGVCVTLRRTEWSQGGRVVLVDSEPPACWVSGEMNYLNGSIYVPQITQSVSFSRACAHVSNCCHVWLTFKP